MAPPPGKEEDLCHGPRRVCGRADSWTVRCRAFRGARAARARQPARFPTDSLALAPCPSRCVRRPPLSHTWTSGEPSFRVFLLYDYELYTALFKAV